MNLSGVYLKDGYLPFANLTNATLTNADLSGARFNTGTLLPDGQKVTQHGFDVAALQTHLLTEVGVGSADGITITTGLAGDYNDDGTVDAADYTMWYDGNRPNTTTAGYALWVDNFGQSSASSSGANPVPEPTNLLLALFALVAAPLRVRCG